jgi:hypothetical protein
MIPEVDSPPVQSSKGFCGLGLATKAEQETAGKTYITENHRPGP